jgi:hypothetical protein
MDPNKNQRRIAGFIEPCRHPTMQLTMKSVNKSHGHIPPTDQAFLSKMMSIFSHHPEIRFKNILAHLSQEKAKNESN